MAPDVLASRTLTRCVDVGAVSRVLDAAAQMWSDAPHVPAEDRMRFETAVAEVVGNVVLHAPGSGDFAATVHLAVHEDRLVADVEDNGDPSLVDLDAPMPHPEAEHGRGIPLARRLLDALTYDRHEGINRWHLERGIDAAREAGS